MAKPGALLLLLAAVASSVAGQSVTLTGNATTDIFSCRIGYFGSTYEYVTVDPLAGGPLKICFKKAANSSADNCIEISQRENASTVVVETGPGSPDGSSLHTTLTDFIGAATCNLTLGLVHDTKGRLMAIDFESFTSQTAMKIQVFSNYTTATFTMTAIVEGSVQVSNNITNADAAAGVYFDLSGCRANGAVFLPDSRIRLFYDTCREQRCKSTATTAYYTTCRPWDVCIGNNTCVKRTVQCAVSGSSVIDFFNNHHDIEDRCVYTLVEPQSGTSFKLLAGFRERSRKDVPFLDYLILEVGGSVIHLEQNGQVRVDGRSVSHRNGSKTLGGVDFIKNTTGMTFTLPSTQMEVFFDGYTAIVTGPLTGVQGLCGKTTNSYPMHEPDSRKATVNVSTEVSTSYSAAGCDVKYSDTIDPMINCTSANQLCGAMNLNNLRVCNQHLPTALFEQSCNKTLCEYPEIDNVRCSILAGYAKACEMKANIVLGDWWTAAGCLPDAYCHELDCSHHEYCGDKKYEGRRCYCRAIFADDYNSTNIYGTQTVCTDNSAAVQLPQCLLEDRAVDYVNLHLNNKSCTGVLDDDHMVNFNFDINNLCGTEVTEEGGQIVYKNAITMLNTSNSGVINRQDEFKIDLSCYYSVPELQSLTLRLKDSTVVQRIVSGRWNYTLTMKAYGDRARTILIDPNSELLLNEPIYMELKAEELDENMVSLLTKSCWVTGSAAPGSTPRYDLIMNGCVNSADSTIATDGTNPNGVGKTNRFTFNMFQFSGGSTEIYLHCQVELCTTACAPTCVSKRKRRAARMRDEKNKRGSPSKEEKNKGRKGEGH